MKTKLGLATIGLLLGHVTTATAALFFPEPGPLYFQFTNLEQTDIGVDGAGAPTNGTSTCPGCSGDPEGNWGIAQLSILRVGDENPAGANPGDIGNDIDSAGLPPTFADQIFPTLGNQVTAIFYGITQTDISTSGTVVSLASTDGFLDLYYDEPGLPGGGTVTNIGSDLPSVRQTDSTAGDYTDGIFLARLEFASGIDPSDSTTFIQGTIDTSLANNSGSADSYADVVPSAGGAWATLIDSDWFGTTFGTRDLRFSNKIDLNTDWNNGATTSILGLTSNDPGRSFVEVPEPSILALVGFGLLGLGVRRKAKKYLA